MFNDGAEISESLYYNGGITLYSLFGGKLTIIKVSLTLLLTNLYQREMADLQSRDTT